MFLKRHKRNSKHESVEDQLDSHEKTLSEVERRLRVLEIEAGIYKPPLKRVQ